MGGYIETLLNSILMKLSELCVKCACIRSIHLFITAATQKKTEEENIPSCSRFQWQIEANQSYTLTELATDKRIYWTFCVKNQRMLIIICQRNSIFNYGILRLIKSNFGHSLIFDRNCLILRFYKKPSCHCNIRLSLVQAA